jgi:phosphoenolpyruvate-protein kinase (PTS system EI component)
MGPRAIPEAKHLISRLDDEMSRQIAEKALSLGTAAEIEAYMQQILDEI